MMGQIYRQNLLFLLGGQTRPLPFSDIPPTAATSSPPKGGGCSFVPISGNREKRGGGERERERSFSAKSTRQIGGLQMIPPLKIPLIVTMEEMGGFPGKKSYR